MKLRTRILVFSGITLSCLILGIYILSSRLLMKSYTELENRDAERNIQRASLGFAQLAADLHIKAVDWAEWDDSYQFMADHSKAFVKSNMVESSIVSMQLDIVMYVDKHGKLFCAQPVKRFKKIAAPSPEQILAVLDPQRLRTEKSDASGGFYGVIDLPAAPMLVTVRPVLTTKATGPARGWLVFGRYFDPGALKSLAERTCLDVSAWELDSDNMPADGTKALKSLKASGKPLVRVLDNDSIASYAFMSDIGNRPLLLLRVKLPRSIYLQGVHSLQYLMSMILFASLYFSIVILLNLECFAFSRLTNLTKQVGRIGSAHSVNRVDLPGRDELTLLADTINGMLVTLEQTSQSLLERTQQVEHQAFHDGLTGLPNRALFMDRLESAKARALCARSPIAVIFIDLDNFKMVNDSLGHDAGDQLLKEIAERLTQCVRCGDTVARLGGDEFTVLMENVDTVQDAIGVAERITDALASPIRLKDREVFASASLGIDFQEEPTETADEMLRNADAAMYEAKANGKAGYILFDPSVSTNVAEGLEIEMGIRFALERDQFFLNYQPLISLESGHIVGVEALLRWQHPTRGTVLPEQFIPIAETTGAIVPIGYWVLEEACGQVKQWCEECPDFGSFTMNVNLSGKQLQRPDVVDRVQEVLVKTGVNPANIKLEITESIMMTDMEVTVERLRRLKALGIKLAIDDFGTGYSSMAILDSFPLDTVKIDRTFIDRLSSTERDSSHIVEAIIALAKALHLDVTGEGVETLHQADQLRRLGCDIVQGYYFARPLSPEDARQFFVADPFAQAKNVTRPYPAPLEWRRCAA
jgi:diguanylate cyclase (GGDEF)-like protein